MSTYVLVHSAWVGGWCWQKVVPLLEQAGHRVETLDLPGHGQDRTPLGEITLAAYTQRVCEALDAQAEPVVLVGHSMGGIVITQVAEERPEKIQTLVYLSAFPVQNGESLFQLASGDTDSLSSRFVTGRSPQPCRKRCIRRCHANESSRCRPATRLSSPHPSR